MMIMVRKAGRASEKSEKSILEIFVVIIAPTMIRAGAVAQAGISPARGVIKKHRRNRIPITTAVRPVLPPELTPVADSM